MLITMMTKRSCIFNHKIGLQEQPLSLNHAKKLPFARKLSQKCLLIRVYGLTGFSKPPPAFPMPSKLVLPESEALFIS